MLGKILVVDDDQSMCDLLRRHLGDRGFLVTSKTKADEAFAILAREDFDLVLTDLNMSRMNGIELCDRIVSNYPHLPVIVITAFGSLETAVEAIRVGAYDFVTKPIDLDALAHSVSRAIKHSKLGESIKRLSSPDELGTRMDTDILGESTAAIELRSVIARSVRSELPLFISGETGCGKELAARVIHRQGERRGRPFIVFNCATTSEQTLEAELFGCSEREFRVGHTGALLQANGGTLFLKEIAHLPPSAQKHLERVLSLGGIKDARNALIPFDVRLIVTSSTSLEELVRDGDFRPDLFQRLSVIHISVPPLRDRENDVLLLAQHFIRQFSKRHRKEVLGIASGAAAKLIQYSWPGNIRELRNAIERGVALTSHERLVVEDLPENVRRYRHTGLLLAKAVETQFLPMEEVERKHILKVLESLDGNKLLAAKVLGLDRRTLYRKLEKYGF